MYSKYLYYVIKHKWFVFLECVKMGIVWRGLVHDLSKFRPSEFIPYARNFYGKYPENYMANIIPKLFDEAWLFHIHRNPHHWQFWLLQEDDGKLKNIPIPLKYLKEMVADWRGAGRAITGKDNIKGWYLENKHKINLRAINRLWVEHNIGLC